MIGRAWVGLVAVVLLGISPRAHATTYTLEDIVERVSRDFPAVAAAREGVAAAEAQLRAARLAWLPAGDATLYISGSPNVKCLSKPYDPTDVGNAKGSNTPDPNQAVREANCMRTNVVSLNNNASGSSLVDIAPIHGLVLRLDVTLNQPIYSFGRIEAGIAAGKASVENATAALYREQADAVVLANRAYFGVKAARAALGTLNEGVEKLREWIAKIDQQLNGRNTSHYSESDLARLKVSLSFVLTQVYDQDRNLAYAERGLQLLLNDPHADVDDRELELASAEEPEPLDAWQQRARQRRPEMRLLAAGAHNAASVRAARFAEMLPELTFNTYLGVGYASSIDTPQNYFFNRPNFVNATFGLQLHQPLDLGVRVARWQQAKHDERATSARGRQSTLAYATDVAKAYEDYREARARARETSKGERISRGWFTSIDSNVASGLSADGREAVEAAQNYFSFRLRNLQAVFEANMALAQLQRVTASLK